MPSDIRAKFRLPDGGEMTLNRDDSWTFGDGVPELTQDVLSEVQPWAFVDSILNDYGPYYDEVVSMTGAEIVFVAEDDAAPPDAVF